jgi:hypothetical protein
MLVDIQYGHQVNLFTKVRIISYQNQYAVDSFPVGASMSNVITYTPTAVGDEQAIIRKKVDILQVQWVQFDNIQETFL